LKVFLVYNNPFLYKTPINIDTNNIIVDKNKLSIHYSNLQNTYSIENDKYIEYETKSEDSYIFYDGNKYILDQFHFHNSSENTKNNIYYPLECHFVHKYHNDIDNQDYTLIIGLLFQISKNDGSEITNNITENLTEFKDHVPSELFIASNEVIIQALDSFISMNGIITEKEIIIKDESKRKL
jgi:carbonic anhydrase